MPFCKRLVFLYLIIFISGNIYSQFSVDSDYVFALHDNILSENRFAECNDPNASTTLPFGIVKEIGSTKYVIAIDSATFYPSTTYLRAYMAMDFPHSSERIAFAAQNIKFNPTGVTGNSFSRLLLVSKHVISLGPKVKLILEPNGRNFIEWDCNGYKGVNLSGYFEFSNSMLLPDSTTSTDSVVRASFEIYTQDIHNFIAQVSITPFTIKGLKDFSFSVVDATVDMSELLNAPGMAFPATYPNNSGSDINSWSGFFLRQVKVKLPSEFSKGDKRVEIYADNFLIDNIGVSGIVGVNNLLSTAEGSMNGWSFSVDNFSATFVANKLNGGSIAGKILLPVSEETPLLYSASVFYNSLTEQTDYTFIVQPGKNISVSAFSAKMDIYNTSRIIVRKENGKFKPEAVLNGRITVENETAKLKGIAFEQLVLVTEKPYLVNGVFGLVSSGDSVNENHVSRFPISINNFMLHVNDVSPAIAFDAAFNFMSKEDKGFAAISRIKVIAKIDNVSDWKYDKIVIGSVALDSRTGFFKLAGIVNFHKEDPVYGNGFYGSIAMQFDKFIESPVSVSACFGNKDDYKYWFVDAAVPVKIPVGSGLSIYRLMGGLRYHMKQNDGSKLASVLYNTSPAVDLRYYPDNTAGLAFTAGVTLALSANDKTFNGDVAFEIAFNNTGGLSTVKFGGDVFFMTGINDRLSKPLTSVPVRASMIMVYDHSNASFHSVLSAIINAGILKGAGQCVAHFDPEVKYICIGRPSSRFTLSIANIASVQSYFMIGNKLEPMPPAPPLVLSIVGESGLDKMRDEDKVTSGKGFVFGASMNTSASKEVSFLSYTVYGGFAMTIGFDMMLLDYGKNAICSNLGTRPGIDGWYSTGQVYTAMQGNVGIKGEALRQKFDLVILSGSVAALLNAQFPKPYYFEGRVGCSYEILSLIRGNFDFDFSAGNYCSIVN